MPIHPRARDIAQRIRTTQASDPDRDVLHFQEKSDIDGNHHWLAFYKIDLDKLVIDAHLETVVQAMLINHRIIEPPTKE